jgi:hypothetical protein
LVSSRFWQRERNCDGGVPVEFRLVAVLPSSMTFFGKRERLDGEVGVGQVGVVVVRAVADAAVVGLSVLLLLADVPLVVDEVLAGLDDGGFEILAPAAIMAVTAVAVL